MMTMRSSTHLGLAMTAAVLAVALTAACSSTESADDEADRLEQTAAAAIGPKELMRCWIEPDTSTSDPFFQVHPMSCAATLPLDYPLPVKSFSYDIRTASNNAFGQFMTNGATKVVARLRSSDFPVTLKLRASFSYDTQNSVGTDLSTYGLTQTFTIAAPNSIPKDVPAAIATPFTVWPVTLRSALTSGSVSSSYALPIAPLFLGGVNGEAATKQELGVKVGLSLSASTQSFPLIAPATGPIALRILSRAGTTNGEISGPGVYELSAAGTLTKMSGATPAGDASVADGSASSDAPVADSAAPSCGTDNQPRCAGSDTCATGFRYKSSDNLCHVCGGDGQTYCDTSSNDGCNAGTRYISSQAICRVCGGDGQTFCNTSANKGCNAGTRYISSQAICRVCGGDGQTYCDTAANGGCNVGTVYKSSDAMCHSCGGVGQPACN